jgi:hypothetical protein
MPRRSEDLSAQRGEAGTKFGGEQIRLFEGSEMPASGDFVPIDQIRIYPLAPDLERSIHFAGEDADGDRRSSFCVVLSVAKLSA